MYVFWPGWVDRLLTAFQNFKWPSIPGLKDKFKGRVTHTARWPKDYQAEQWKNDRVAVIGSGVGVKPQARGLRFANKKRIGFLNSDSAGNVRFSQLLVFDWLADPSQATFCKTHGYICTISVPFIVKRR